MERTRLGIRYINVKRLCFICFFMALINCFSFQAYAAENRNTVESDTEKNETDSIVKIVTVYTDESGNIYYAKQGTGFVIGVNQEDTNGEKYIVSDYGIVQGETVYLDAIRKKYGISDDVKLTIGYYAIGNMGVMSELKILSYSDETRYVVLEPSGTLADKEYLKLGEGESVVKDARIHIEGYSGARNIVAASSVEERSINKYDTVIKDVVTQDYYDETITYFHVGEPIDEGMAGAPVLDQNGCVVGMFIMQNGSIKAMSIENLRVVLDSLSIKYMVAEDDASYDVPTQNQKQMLKQMINENKEYICSIEKNKYTLATWENLYNAISEADSVYLNSASTAKQYDDSMEELSNARKKLRTKAFKWMLINVIAGVVILVLLVVLCRILKKQKKIKNQKEKIAKMSELGDGRTL